ncbi:MAG: ParB N-terminal domain-containing protein [Syntrophales bacterium]|jgi:ParB-like chromosome segregation protein Spo0J|nr:ParB N-terminal domain-containing protein [Syntrophales bacterium]
MPEVHCAHDKMVAIGELKPNPRNPNIHPEKQIILLARIIEAQGWRSPITVSNLTGLIVRGHGRYEAARWLECAEVPVDFQDYASEAEEWQDLLADNRIAELSQVDDDLLCSILQDIDLDVELAGYDTKFVAELLARKEVGELRREILAEEEYQEARNTADRIIEAMTEKVRRLADTDPERLNSAVAVVIQKGRGNQTLFFLADPNTADAVTELRRLADAEEHSPLESLMEAAAP